MVAGRSLYLIDGDTDSREAMATALRDLGWNVYAFGQIAEYLKRFEPYAPGCVLLKDYLDADSHRELLKRKHEGSSIHPVIYVPRSFNVKATIEVFRRFTSLLAQSRGHAEMLLATARSVAESPDVSQSERAVPSDEMLANTTLVERKCLALLSAGRSNKQILQELQMPLRSFQRLKSLLFRRLQIESPNDLVRINDRLAQMEPAER
jgi:FixJ family two-component response regulator